MDEVEVERYEGGKCGWDGMRWRDRKAELIMILCEEEEKYV